MPELRFILGLAIAGVLCLSHYYAYEKGKERVTLEWDAAKAAANVESRKIEQLRQSRVDEAQKARTERENRLRADAASAADAVAGLRNALSAKRSAEESAAAAAHRADSLGELLVQGAEAHKELAERCDRHVNDLRTLLEAWPK